MSQEVEYLLRDVRHRHGNTLANRISQAQRRAAEMRAQQILHRDASQLEGRLLGELEGLRQEVQRRNADIQKQLDCNRHLAEALQTRSARQDERLDEYNRALSVLREHDQVLAAQLRENEALLTRLAEQQARTERRLNEEIARRHAERQRQTRNLQAQKELGTHLMGRLERGKMQALGLRGELAALEGTWSRAVQLAESAGDEQAGLALVLEAQNRAEALLVEHTRRETEIGRLREIVRLTVETAELRLTQLREDREVVYLFEQPLQALANTLADLRREMTESAGVDSDFGRLLGRWTALADQARAVQARIEAVWQEKDLVLDQVRRRNHVVEAILRSLMDVWGVAFEVDHSYAVADDPRSTLMLQTKRPHGKNATLHLDLDGRIQVSFTGYVGMECAHDVEEFRRKLQANGEMKVEQEARHDHPDAPNPGGVDGVSGPLIYRPPARQPSSKSQEERRT